MSRMSIGIEAKPAAMPVSRSVVGDYVELLKLRLSSLVLVSMVVGFYLGYAGPADVTFFMALLHAVLGTALVAGGAMALNQWMERDSDALMERTRNRPLPSGRIGAGEAFVFGLLISVAGLAYLAVMVNLLTAALAALTIGSYLLLYTPLKRRTPLCTLVGAVPGAIPPMMGYTAATGEVTAIAWVLFAILFVWQMPHFLAIAWLYREDYARGGQMMLPVVDPAGTATARHVILFSLTLVPVTLMPALLGMAGLTYFIGALAAGGVFLAFAVALAVRRTNVLARQVFLASVIYLPALLGLLMFDHGPHRTG